MIQRKQTLFLLLAAVLGVVAMSLPVAEVTAEGLTLGRIYSLLWVDVLGAAHYDVWPMFGILLLASALSLCSIFLYRRRIVQSRVCIVGMLLYVLWYIAFIVCSKMLAPDAVDFHPTLVSALPAISAILCFMAYKGILADEKLVRAADRIR